MPTELQSFFVLVSVLAVASLKVQYGLILSESEPTVLLNYSISKFVVAIFQINSYLYAPIWIILLHIRLESGGFFTPSLVLLW